MSDETPKGPRAREERWPWCTEERLLGLCALLREGVPVNRACSHMGVPRESLRQARKDDPSVDALVEAALGEYERELHDAIRDAKADDWKAAAWLLERRFPKRYAPPPKQVQQSGPGGGPQKVEIAVKDSLDSMSDEDVERAARSILKERGT